MTGSSPPTLILLHGATCNGQMWNAVRRHLDGRFTVLTPDLPGHGARRGESFSLAGAVDAVVQAAKSVAGSPLVLGGDSLGGYTSIAAAEALPAQQLKGLVIAGASSNLSGFALLPYLGSIALFKTLLMLQSEERLLNRLRPKLESDLQMQSQDAKAMADAGMSLKVFAQAVAALKNIDFRAKIGRLSIPIQFINGTLDRGHMRQEPSFLAAAKQASAAHIQGCKHGVTVRRPSESAHIINSFALPRFGYSPS